MEAGTDRNSSTGYIKQQSAGKGKPLSLHILLPISVHDRDKKVNAGL